MTKYNPRYLLWCQETNRDPSLPFGGCDNNLEFMQWISNKWSLFWASKGLTERQGRLSEDFPNKYTEFDNFIGIGE